MPEPDATQDIHGTEDATLGGYFRIHERPPAFEGSDGHPYTVSVEVERQTDLRSPWAAYLVFPRWAESGVGIIGHLETGLLSTGSSEEEVRSAVGELPLETVQEHLEEAIGRQDGDPASSDENNGR